MELLEKELTYKIRGCFFEAVKKYGRGLKESIYQKALAEELSKIGLQYEEQKRIDIYSIETGKKLGTYIPDFVVEGKVIIEVKSFPFTRQQDINQQRSYLRASIYEIGYLVNFGSEVLDIKRSIYTNNRKPFIIKLEK